MFYSICWKYVTFLEIFHSSSWKWKILTCKWSLLVITLNYKIFIYYNSNNSNFKYIFNFLKQFNFVFKIRQFKKLVWVNKRLSKLKLFRWNKLEKACFLMQLCRVQSDFPEFSRLLKSLKNVLLKESQTAFRSFAFYSRSGEVQFRCCCRCCC